MEGENTMENKISCIPESEENALEKVYIRLPEETLGEFRRLNPDVKIIWRLIGNRRYPCAVYDLPRGSADVFNRMQQAEARSEQREVAGYQSDGRGGYIHRSSRKKRNADENAPSSANDRVRFVSYEEMKSDVDQLFPDDNRFDDPGLDEEEVKWITENILRYLNKKYPKQGTVFSELLSGNVHPAGIARSIGSSNTNVHKYISDLRPVVMEFYFRLLDA